MPRLLHSMLLVSLLLVTPQAFAERVEVPLNLDLRYLEGRVAAALGLDEQGRGRLAEDACNRVDVSDMELASADGRLRVSMAVTADVGTYVFGQCRGPGRWQGRMLVDMAPSVDEEGLLVRLSPETAELRRPDGSEGLLTRPARLLAENLILPRMRETVVDLREPLNALDAMLQQLLVDAGSSAPELTDRSRLSRVSVEDDGIRAMLVFDLQPGAPRDPAAEPPLDESELAEWQRLEDELDGFLTAVISQVARHAEDRGLQLDLLGVLLDARWAISRALVEDDPRTDPVRELFVETWNQLRPHMAELDRTEQLPQDVGLQLAAFVAGGDAITALDALGPEYGVEVSRDGLRRLARMLLADDAPARFTPLPLEVDPILRDLFQPQRSQAWEEQGGAYPLLRWLIAEAHAAPSPAEALRGRVPRLATLDEYLDLVSQLLGTEARARLVGESRVPHVFRYMLDPLVRATAWKESCWRQYHGSTSNPRVLTSSVGALGMMQVHARVWRGVYDQQRLADDVQYNVRAGIEILEYYLVDYAIRRGEHRQPGGIENLVRATYAAYNGGPGHLSRYRRDDVQTSLRIIDREFWRHYQIMKETRWPDVGSCYPVS
ncbi:MAG: transglycosylase SLT domain-containing protein [Ectothiorhodospiraceae bacterium]|nr:transglycosylase SLT domain-containing protein [Ectothiorhodospiraceae bacterium]